MLPKPFVPFVSIAIVVPFMQFVPLVSKLVPFWPFGQFMYRFVPFVPLLGAQKNVRGF